MFKAFNYTKFNRIEKLPIIRYEDKTTITFKQKCEAFMKVLFTNPPQTEAVKWDNYKESHWEWPKIDRDEIKDTIFSCSTKSAAGPDGMSYLIIQKAFNIIETRFVKLYSKLFQYGYHPICWREATGVILKKPNRDASLPKSYRVISLLNYLEKIFKKIIVKKLAHLANTLNIIHFN